TSSAALPCGSQASLPVHEPGTLQFLCFPLGMGLAGIWWGLAAGLGLVAAMLVLFIWRRGPERARPVAEWEA
ncbi:MAG TPA: hypothetical protein VMS76_12375, partial [Planctomycetota bacterium]|nr:hypothetical protein [Planctomycetota bacterium]